MLCIIINNSMFAYQGYKIVFLHTPPVVQVGEKRYLPYRAFHLTLSAYHKDLLLKLQLGVRKLFVISCY